MNTRNCTYFRQEGSVIVASVIMLAIAGFTVGAILTANMSYSKHIHANMCREKAAFLADAGLNAALVKLNAYSDGNISLTQSHSYFSDTNAFDDATLWGFQTRIKVINGTNYIESVGVYKTHDGSAEAAVTLGSGSRSIHALYAHALFAGNANGSNYVLKIGGTGSGADFIRGDIYCGGDIEVSGDARLRLPEDLKEVVHDGIFDPNTETWIEAFAPQVFSNPLPPAAFAEYKASMEPYMDKVYIYNNNRYDFGEAFLDTIGNGVYDEGEPFVDKNGNGVRDSGDGYIDENGNGIWDEGETIVDNGNGVWDEGEEWTDNTGGWHNKRKNGRYDPAGGFWEWNRRENKWEWKTSYWRWWRKYDCSSWPPEDFEDTGNGNFDPGEEYVDQNGVYDEGEEFVDDRNGTYDYGVQARGRIVGMPPPGVGQRAATGGDPPIDPPDLVHMFYHVSKNDSKPIGALERWGHDVAVTADDYGEHMVINDCSRPEHIFVRNPPNSGYTYVYDQGVRVYKRSYSYVYDKNNQRVDDYFFEDPTDPTYNSYVSSDSIDGTAYTAPMYINVRPEHNVKLYYVEGNVYIHHPRVYSMRFRQPGTRITIVAKGNIIISDEFYYNADYDKNLTRSDMNSTVVKNPSDALCLIALKNPDCPNSGNIYIGDAQFGTGGSIHAMLYAENNFIDNNLNTSGQPFISIFGNMSAGNQLRLNRQDSAGYLRTRLDVTLDERIKDGEIIVPGLPHPIGNQRSIQIDTAWHILPGTWKSWSMLQ